MLLTWGSECTINLGLSQLIRFAASSNTAVADEFSLRPTKNRRQEKRNDRIAVFRLIYINVRELDSETIPRIMKSKSKHVPELVS